MTSKVDLAAATGPANWLDGRVLVLAPVGLDARIVCQVLEKNGLEAQTCSGMDHVCREIDRGASAVLLAEEALSAASRRRLNSVLASQPSWSDLPLLVMSSFSRKYQDSWQWLQETGRSSHLILLERPLHMAALVSAVRSAVASRQRQYQIRDELAGREKVESELRQSRERLDFVLSVTSVGIWFNDLPFGRLSWDQQTRKLFFAECDIEPNIELFWSRLHPEDREPTRQAVDAAIRDGTIFAGDLRAVHPDTGAIRWIHSVGQATYAADGTPTHFAGVCYDITARRRAEEQLRNFTETLEQQVAERTEVAENRARDLRRLAAELSEAEHRERTRLAKLLHDDLQQLLLAVQLRLSALAESPSDQLEQAIADIDQLVTDCQRTSRNLSLELSPPILQRGTLLEVMRWLRDWFDEKYALRIDLETEETILRVPEHLGIFLFQSVRELLLNVVKHANCSRARLAIAAEEEMLRIQVEDDGRQFDPVAVETRLDRPESFGLFNIRERLEALGGRMELRRTSQGGASVEMVVPAAEARDRLSDEPGDETVMIAASHADSFQRPSTAVRLLVAEDHAVVREGLVGLLNRQPDIEVIGEAADGVQAIEQTDILSPDVVIMDVDMPVMDGVEATRQIKQRHPQTLVIGLSLYEEESVTRAMLEAGATAYVSKHAPARDVIDAIRRACLNGRDER